MWKLVLAFAAFAGLAIFVLTKSGGDIDMSGEKHDVAAPHAETSASEAAPAPAAASAVASAASN